MSAQSIYSINGSYYIIKTEQVVYKTKFNNSLCGDEGRILRWSYNIKLKLRNTFLEERS